MSNQNGWKLVTVRLAVFALIAGVGAIGAAPALAAPLIAGDLNHDGSVDVTDAGWFVTCLSGPGTAHNSSDMCDEADLDHDGNVDVSDFGMIQPCFSGTGIPGDPACGGCVRPRASRTVTIGATEVYSGDYTVILVDNSQEGVNYQLRNNAGNANIGSPVAGTGDTIALSSGPITAATTFNVLATNAVMGCSVQLANTVSVTVVGYSSHGIVGNSFTVENPTVSVNQQVWFHFNVTNTSGSVVEYSALAGHTDVGFTAWSWTNQHLNPGQTLDWRDHIEFDRAGTYQLYLGICFAAGGKDACPSGPWDRLSPKITITVQ